MYRNPYQPLSEEERRKKEEAIAEQKKELLACVELAKKCLKNEDFAKYKEKYLKAEQGVINNIIRLDLIDPVKYAFAVREMVTDLRAIKTLLSEVEKDAGKKV